MLQDVINAKLLIEMEFPDIKWEHSKALWELGSFKKYKSKGWIFSYICSILFP